jgi:hypothetical protein
MARMGTNWERLPNGDLKTTTAALTAARNDIRFHPPRRVFFNSMVAAFLGWADVRNDSSKAVVLGDGRPIDAAALSTIAGSMEEVKVAFKRQAGDVLLVDNTSAMHARHTFVPPRTILASIARGIKPLPRNPGIIPSLPVGKDASVPATGFGFWKVPKDDAAAMVVEVHSKR